MNLSRYLELRRYFEVGFWIAWFGVQNTVGALTVLADHARAGSEIASWEPFSWEYSSALAMVVLVPLVVWFDRRFPLYPRSFKANLPWHLVASFVFTVLHVGGMVQLRKWIYLAFDRSYDFGVVATEFIYEYRKDFMSYFTIIIILYVYRFIITRLQGEASFPDAEESSASESLPDRFLVKTLGREFLVKIDDIDWLESSGNYVTLHCGLRLFPMRGTLSELAERLAERGFQRVHRRAVVNLDKVAEIKPYDTGDAELTLKTGATLNVSRRYRAELRERFG